MDKKNLTDARALCKKLAGELRSFNDQQKEIASKVKEAKEEASEEQRSKIKQLEMDIVEKRAELRQAELEVQELELEKRMLKIDEEHPIEKAPLLQDVIRRAIQGNPTEDDKKFNERGRAILGEAHLDGVDEENLICIPLEKRATQNATGTPNLGGNTIEDVRMPLMMPLVNSLILGDLGVTEMNGLTGNPKFPKGSAVEAYWEGEEDEAGETNATFENITFSPKRVSAVITVTNQLLKQSSEDVQAYLMNRMMNAVGQTIQNKIFSADAATANTRAGLFYSATALPSKSFDWANIMQFKTKLKKDNSMMQNVKWVTTPDVTYAGETTLKASGVAGYILQDNKMAGYQVVDSNAVPSDIGVGSDESGIILADWKEFFFGTWGAFTIGYDPYTKMTQDSIRLVVNAYVDFGKLRDESFAIATTPVDEVEF